METRIVQYFISQPTPISFPKFVIDMFVEEHQHGMINVNEGSTREAEFLDMALQKGLISQLSKNKVLLCNKEEINKHNFYFLHLKQDKTYKMPAFWEYDEMCYSDKSIICRNGVEQKSKITLDPKKSNYGVDIMSSPYLPYPILISRKLKKLMEEEGVTGYHTVPCLEAGVDYPESYLSFSESSYLDLNAKYYQMVVDSRVKRGPYVGNAHITQQCPRCGVVQGFFSDVKANSEGCFSESDISNSDIQFYDTYSSENHGEFKVAMSTILVSSNLLSILMRKDLKGIRKYSSLYKLPYRFIDMCR